MKKIHTFSISIFIILGAIIYGWMSVSSDHKENPLARFKLDKVSRKMAAQKGPSRAPAVLPSKELMEDKSIDPVGHKDFLQADNPLLIQLTRQLQRINKSCEKIAEDIFNDNNYIDPQFELYQNPEKILKLMSRVFNEMLVHQESQKAFQLLKGDIEKSPEEGVAPATWDKVLRSIDVCRENEIFYFFETLFESFRYDHLDPRDKNKILKTFILRLKVLLQNQQSMTNLLFVTNLIIKSSKALGAEEYVLTEGKRIFDDLIDFWRINVHYYKEQSERKNTKQKSLEFYRDYFRQSEYYNQELSKIIEDILI